MVGMINCDFFVVCLFVFCDPTLIGLHRRVKVRAVNVNEPSGTAIDELFPPVFVQPWSNFDL